MTHGVLTWPAVCPEPPALGTHSGCDKGEAGWWAIALARVTPSHNTCVIFTGKERYNFHPNPFVEDMRRMRSPPGYRYVSSLVSHRGWCIWTQPQVTRGTALPAVTVKLGDHIDLIGPYRARRGVMTGANGEVSFNNIKTSSGTQGEASTPDTMSWLRLQPVSLPLASFTEVFCLLSFPLLSSA